jgi:hypothetical protein
MKAAASPAPPLCIAVRRHYSGNKLLLLLLL